jgi:hypothetical protein
VQLAFDDLDSAPVNGGTITEDTTPRTETSGNGNNIGNGGGIPPTGSVGDGNEDDVFRLLNAIKSETGAQVAARLNLGNETFDGTNLARGNAPIKGTFSFFVEHAEGDVFSKALSSGEDYAGQSGTLQVTQPPCSFCVASISTTARSMGLSRLTISTPDGVFGLYTPETGLVRGP